MNQCKECQSETTNPSFCSRNCAAAFNNRMFPKRSKIVVLCSCGKPKSHKKNKRCRECDWIQRKHPRLPPDRDRTCAICKETKQVAAFYRPNGKTHSYCRECGKLDTIRRQREAKRKFVEYKGGKCEKCGYNECLGALQFHHKDPSTKEFNISRLKSVNVCGETKEELDKCILLCANCHAEEHWREDYTLRPGGIEP